jgi:glutaredoxin-related protein
MTNQQKILGAVCGVACCAGLFFFTYKPKPETVLVEVESIRPISIYDAKTVYWYAKNHKNENAEIAESYLNKARLLEAVNLQKAIYNVKRAITLYPDAEHYKFLASLLNKAGQYNELVELYPLLASKWNFETENGNEEVYIFGAPDEDTFYEYLAASFLDDKVLEGYILDGAEEQGFSKSSLKKRFLADSRINLVPETEAYKNVMLQFMTEEEIAEYTKSEANFRNFLASIKDTTAVFTIDEKSVQAFDYRNQEEDDDYDGTAGISDFYIHYLEEKQQHPDKWYDFNVNRKIQINDSVQAILYAIDTSETACPADMRHIYHRLVAYTKKGGIIQSKIVALQSGEALSTLHFSGISFTVTDHRRTWKKPYKKADFDNYVTKTESLDSKHYVITGDGQIREQEATASAGSVPATEL